MSGQVKVDLQRDEAVSRRKFSAFLGSFASVFAFSTPGFWANGDHPIAISAGEEEVSHSCEVIHQTVVFKASRMRVYEALTDEKQFDKVVKLSLAVKQVGAGLGTKPTQIARDVGGTFTVFGG